MNYNTAHQNFPGRSVQAGVFDIPANMKPQKVGEKISGSTFASWDSLPMEGAATPQGYESLRQQAIMAAKQGGQKRGNVLGELDEQAMRGRKDPLRQSRNAWSWRNKNLLIPSR